MSKQRGFSIIELLIVVAVIGVLATIALPNLLSAVERGRQKRSLADIRSLATAIESYASDNTGYPFPGASGSIELLRPYLEPFYTQTLHVEDGWGRPYIARVSSAGADYTFISYGKDGVLSGPSRGPTTLFTDDIVFSGGAFLTWPEGVQND